MSITYISIVVSLVVALGNAAGIKIAADDVQTTVSTIVLIVSALTGLYGRWRAGGITPLGTRAK